MDKSDTPSSTAIRECPVCNGNDPSFGRHYELVRTPTRRLTCLVCGREFAEIEALITMTEETAPAEAPVEDARSSVVVEPEAVAPQEAEVDEVEDRKVKLEAGTHVLHEDGHLVEVGPDFSADKSHDNWRKQRRVLAKDGNSYEAVAIVGDHWAYREAR